MGFFPCPFYASNTEPDPNPRPHRENQKPGQAYWEASRQKEPGTIMLLKREDSDFSGLAAGELVPALLWEIRRESGQAERVVLEAQAWLAGKAKKPPTARDSRPGKRPRYNARFSEAEAAWMRALSVFGDFIALEEFYSVRKWSRKQRRTAWNRWVANSLRPLLRDYNVPWLCLPDAERQRLCKIFEANTNADVVRIGRWADGIGYFELHKPNAGLPMKFGYSRYTGVFLTINWAHSKKRILAAIGNILKECEPAGVERWNRRGKKNRDVLVMLERLAMMRVLHHFTLAEARLRLPGAWSLYQHRRWYHERQQALKNFRAVVGSPKPDLFPKRPILLDSSANRGGEYFESSMINDSTTQTRAMSRKGKIARLPRRNTMNAKQTSIPQILNL